jgi:beta-glucosidase-like glycosyl hydrolase
LVRSGELAEEQIEEGVRRVLRLKLKYGLLPA